MQRLFSFQVRLHLNFTAHPPLRHPSAAGRPMMRWKWKLAGARQMESRLFVRSFSARRACISSQHVNLWSEVEECVAFLRAKSEARRFVFVSPDSLRVGEKEKNRQVVGPGGVRRLFVDLHERSNLSPFPRNNIFQNLKLLGRPAFHIVFVMRSSGNYFKK